MEPIFAHQQITDEFKVCNTCGLSKIVGKDFYTKTLNKCKKCTSKANVAYQKKNKTWTKRFVDEEKTISHMKNYYQNHKQKYKEYRIDFMAKNPNYYREYAAKKLKEKNDETQTAQKRKEKTDALVSENNVL